MSGEELARASRTHFVRYLCEVSVEASRSSAAYDSKHAMGARDDARGGVGPERQEAWDGRPPHLHRSHS